MFYGITVVALVAAAGLVSVTSAKWDEQEYLSLALLLDARVEAAGHDATSTHATSSRPTVDTEKSGIHNTGKKEAHYKLITGTIKSVGTNSFVLTARHIDFNVSAGTTTSRVYDRIWAALPFSQIAVGDKVAAYGVVDGTTITARIIRDITKPTHTNNGQGDDNEGTGHGNATSTNHGGGHGNNNGHATTSQNETD